MDHPVGKIYAPLAIVVTTGPATDDATFQQTTHRARLIEETKAGWFMIGHHSYAILHTNKLHGAGGVRFQSFRAQRINNRLYRDSNVHMVAE